MPFIKCSALWGVESKWAEGGGGSGGGNFQCRGVLLVWIRVGQEPTALAVGAGGGC